MAPRKSPFAAAVSILVIALMLTAVGVTRAQEDAPAVNYISADAVYVNVGTYAGLRIGTLVDVVRDGKTIAVLEVIHVSSHSASCRVVEQTEPPRVGDTVSFVPSAAESLVEPPVAALSATRGPTVTQRLSNVMSGYLSYQTVWQKDLSGSDISSLQPALLARIKIANVGGTGGELRFRDRVRLYHRASPLGEGISENEWYHRLMELAFVYGRPGAAVQWSVGRLVVPHMVAAGQIDGGYLTFQFSRYFLAGAVLGLDPDPIGMGIDPDRQRAGGFLAFDYSSRGDWRFASSAALTGSYASGTVNREFVYWQNVFSLYRRLSLFQSVEMDLNRDWRREAAGESVTFSNFYLTANAEASRYASIDFTFDSRKNVRNYDTMSTPDSLFDDRVYNGFGGGLTLRALDGVTFGGRGGIRYREKDTTNRYFSLYATSARLPWRGHAASLRYAYAETEFTTGHRPVLMYRFPAGRLLRVNVSTGGYIYERWTKRTSSFYAEARAYYPFGRYFASGSYRQYFAGNLDSIVFFAELGLNL